MYKPEEVKLWRKN